ncbi:MarR family winged helix-turn-helix transcriptional regulator [Microlunatus parietis]|uniref:DNA-binding MarR family transcriptional regulator n=1 Tax=Microlunatus parietis TaxID=682979 RepID=A0A7Y9I538_9ACTN|nr:MarR family transcriptional regulator [Microlunatus parietis]NYE70445.1 DNA-binding MarR family transcriptional regulator [Microlunatus parietis]
MAEDQVDRMVSEWASAAPDLDVSVLQVIGRVLRTAERTEQRLAAALAPLGLSYPDFDVINTLRRRNDPDGTQPRDLARSALITSGAMTARLDRLVAAGLVQRDADPDDRRAIRVRLTRKGERLAARALDAVLAVDAAVLAPLSERQRTVLAATLKRILLPLEAD